MFTIQDPCSLNRPWILSKKSEQKQIIIPLEVTNLMKNYQILAVEFLYKNYRRGMKGSILNQETGMNPPLQISALFRAIIDSPTIVLIICPSHSTSYWSYHLTNEGGFKTIQINKQNSKDSYETNQEKLALILEVGCLKLCENLNLVDFFSVVIDNFDQLANKLIIKRLDGKFNIGITYRSFYSHPDQKLQWRMLNWANPGCVGKLNDFYEVDNRNLENFVDNYHFWWQRLTWQFCDGFKKPTDAEEENYRAIVAQWASANDLEFPSTEKKAKKRKFEPPEPPETDKTPIIEPPSPQDSDSADTIPYEVPMEKYVKLPSMDESPILTSIIKNFETSPEPILTPYYTQPQPNCSKYEDNSIILSFFEKNQDKPSTSNRSESEEFIVNLFKKPDDQIIEG